jgi:hypothetical protein
VKAQRSFLSGICLSREHHGPKVKVTAPPMKKRKFGTLESNNATYKKKWKFGTQGVLPFEIWFSR